MSPRLLSNGLFSSAIVVALLVFARLIFTPDAGAAFFARAQQLENAGQISLALQHYRLVSEHPESVFAPRALLREGDLLAAQGRKSGDEKILRQAVAVYAKLAKNYASDPLANDALFDAGLISSENLHDTAGAKRFYDLLLQLNSPNSDVAAQATLKLGRLALTAGDGKTAQALFIKVQQRWPRNAMVGAEAQFHLGVVYETLLKKPDAATRAYDATIARYPTSTWANNARERLGLLVFSASQGRPPVRRVLIDVESVPDDNGLSNAPLDSPWNALRPLLAARGMAVSDLTLKGWSLAPFWAALDTTNPARVVKPSFDEFENVVANAGLRFSVKGGGREAEALRDLQDDIDAGHLPVVFFSEKGEARWTLCVGYDSERGEVMLQDRGARFDTLSAKAFSAGWKAKSSFGQPYALLSFVATGKDDNPKPNLTPTPVPSPKAEETPVPVLDAPPTFTLHLPKLNRGDAHRRTLKRAAIVLGRNGNGQVLLGATALDWLANELEASIRVPKSVAPVESLPLARQLNEEEGTVPTPEASPTESALEETTPTPEPTAAPPEPDSAPKASSTRAQQLLGFLGAPARQWVALRRQAGTFCDLAARQTNNSRVAQAAESLTDSATSLEEAMRLAPTLSATLSSEDREAIRAVVRQLRRAREAERQAASLLE